MRKYFFSFLMIFLVIAFATAFVWSVKDLMFVASAEKATGEVIRINKLPGVGTKSVIVRFYDASGNAYSAEEVYTSKVSPVFFMDQEVSVFYDSADPKKSLIWTWDLLLAPIITFGCMALFALSLKGYIKGAFTPKK